MRKTCRIKSLFRALKKNFVLIVAVTVIVMLLGVLYAKLFVTPLYTSSVEVMVSDDSYTTPSTCIAFMKNDVVLQKVTESMEGKYTVSQIRSMLSFERVDDSMFVRITADTPSPEVSRQLCVAVADYTKETIMENTGVDNIIIVGTANTPVSASSPDLLLYGVAGAIIGFVICSIGVCIRALKDNTIKDKRTLTENFDLPFFGEIPAYDTDCDSGDRG